MKEVELQVPASLDQTLPDTTDPMFQLAALARTIHNTLIAMDTAAMVITQAEASDFNTYGSDIKTFIDDMSAREDEILLTGFSSIAANLPDILPIIEAILSGGTAAIPSILLNAVISQMFRSRNSAITANEGEILSDLDTANLETKFDALTAELEGVKEQIQQFKRGLIIPGNGDAAYFIDEFKKFGVDADGLSKLLGVLSEFNINLYNDQYGASWSVGPLEGEPEP